MGFCPESVESEYNLWQLIYAFHMPLFFLISGFIYSLVYFDSAGRPKMSKLWVQLLDFAVAYVLFSAVLVGSKVLFARFVNTPASFSELLHIWRVPIFGPYWYLYTLGLLYLIGIPLLKFDRRYLIAGLVVSFVLSLASGLMALPLDFCVDRVAFFLFFFLLGVAFQRGVLKLGWPLVAGCLCLSVGLCVAFWGESASHFEGGISNKPVVNTLVSLGLSLFFFKVFESVRALDCKFLSFCGSYCLEIYLLHCVFTAGFRSVLTMAGVTSFWPSFVLNIALSTGLSLAIAMVLKKIGLHDIVFRPVHRLQKRREKAHA